MIDGTMTAMITPMLSGGEIDLDGFGELLDFQAENNVGGVVVLGTTGESPTLNESEQKEIISLSVERFKGKVIIGTGTMCTETTLKKTQMARDMGADAALIVTPPYNKPNKSGLCEHFRLAADIMPIIIYDIKGRTGRQIQIDEFAEICRHPNVLGVKAASGDIKQIEELIEKVAKPIRATRRVFRVWSGDDGMTVPIRKLGGDGVISVASNLCPGLVNDIAMLDIPAAEEKAIWAEQLMSAAFIECNPVPIKHMMHAVGLIKSGAVRLPLGPLQPENAIVVEEVAKKYYNNQ
ncbi:MAG: 4-hydroxy-tetrahydrodipicolinate synthase [Rickettsiales bacterium]|jgi:4-hydroxy-tetrahydrodipicolinate synthase|nr:4-hydroxy-tetrahydrodipicolinate synthase [Rickettsiales bacterium]